MIIQNIKSPDKTKKVSDFQWKKLPPSVKSQWKVVEGGATAQKPEELKSFAPSIPVIPSVDPPVPAAPKKRGRKKSTEA